jgi:ABC-type multidrug transport system fused ATPase/permease subunit
VANALEQLLTILVLCVGAWLVMQNAGFTIGMLVAFQMFTSRLAAPMLKLAGLWQEFHQAAIAVRRLGDIMDAPPEPYSMVATPDDPWTCGDRARSRLVPVRRAPSIPLRGPVGVHCRGHMRCGHGSVGKWQEHSP